MINSVCFSPEMIKVIKSRRMRWVGYVANEDGDLMPRFLKAGEF